MSTTNVYVSGGQSAQQKSGGTPPLKVKDTPPPVQESQDSCHFSGSDEKKSSSFLTKVLSTLGLVGLGVLVHHTVATGSLEKALQKQGTPEALEGTRQKYIEDLKDKPNYHQGFLAAHHWLKAKTLSLSKVYTKREHLDALDAKIKHHQATSEGVWKNVKETGGPFALRSKSSSTEPETPAEAPTTPGNTPPGARTGPSPSPAASNQPAGAQNPGAAAEAGKKSETPSNPTHQGTEGNTPQAPQPEKSSEAQQKQAKPTPQKPKKDAGLDSDDEFEIIDMPTEAQ
jgi:hypothetical protein